MMVRRRKLQERYAIIWLCAGLGVVVFGVWGDALNLLADVTGIAYPPSALFLVVAIFLMAMLLHNGVTVSRLSNENQTLAQRVAILDEQLRTLQEKVTEAEGTDSTQLPVTPRVVSFEAHRSRGG